MNYTASYEYSGNMPIGPSGQAAGAIGIGLILFVLLIVAVFYVYFALCLMKVAQKLKVDNAWLAWIPILNFIPMLKSAGKPLWWIILMFISPINAVVAVLVWMEISKRLSKPDWWGILMVIPVANFIIPGILAFSQSAQPAAGAASSPAKPAGPQPTSPA